MKKFLIISCILLSGCVSKNMALLEYQKGYCAGKELCKQDVASCREQEEYWYRKFLELNNISAEEYR